MASLFRRLTGTAPQCVPLKSTEVSLRCGSLMPHTRGSAADHSAAFLLNGTTPYFQGTSKFCIIHPHSAQGKPTLSILLDKSHFVWYNGVNFTVYRFHLWKPHTAQLVPFQLR